MVFVHTVKLRGPARAETRRLAGRCQVFNSRPVRLVFMLVALALVIIGVYGVVTDSRVPAWADLLSMVLLAGLVFHFARDGT